MACRLAGRSTDPALWSSPAACPELVFRLSCLPNPRRPSPDRPLLLQDKNKETQEMI
ncbi:unnamed protein product [Oikopleura dioica]|uniref:Uncharacterized protein n=1 Tax=Oikopleura dioica TaxID=34765 RepID=E4XDZ1_OIKDI|nr:unnamed protein product [Oikopleura dioica]